MFKRLCCFAGPVEEDAPSNKDDFASLDGNAQLCRASSGVSSQTSFYSADQPASAREAQQECSSGGTTTASSSMCRAADHSAVDTSATDVMQSPAAVALFDCAHVQTNSMVAVPLNAEKCGSARLQPSLQHCMGASAPALASGHGKTSRRDWQRSISYTELPHADEQWSTPRASLSDGAASHDAEPAWVQRRSGSCPAGETGPVQTASAQDRTVHEAAPGLARHGAPAWHTPQEAADMLQRMQHAPGIVGSGARAQRNGEAMADTGAGAALGSGGACLSPEEEAWHDIHRLAVREQRWHEAERCVQHALARSPETADAFAWRLAGADGARLLEQMRTIVQQCQRLDADLRLGEADGYTHFSPAPMQALYRKSPHNETAHQFRFVADLPFPGAQVLTLLREFDLTSTWNWSVPEAAIVEERSDASLDTAFVLYLPWPFANRRMAVQLDLVDTLALDGSLTVCMKSKAIDTAKMPPSTRSCPEVFALEGTGMKFEPRWVTVGGSSEPMEGCRITQQLHCDIGISTMPKTLMHFVFKGMAPLVYRLAKNVIVSNVQHTGAPLNVRMQQRATFYEHIRALFEATLALQDHATALHL